MRASVIQMRAPVIEMQVPVIQMGVPSIQMRVPVMKCGCQLLKCGCQLFQYGWRCHSSRLQPGDWQRRATQAAVLMAITLEHSGGFNARTLAGVASVTSFP